MWQPGSVIGSTTVFGSVSSGSSPGRVIGVSKMWKIWCKALGEKSGKDSKESDYIAIIRTIIIIQAVVTNMFITYNILRRW